MWLIYRAQVRAAINHSINQTQNQEKTSFSGVFDKPGVVGAVLHTAPSFIKYFIHLLNLHFPKYLQQSQSVSIIGCLQTLKLFLFLAHTNT